MIKLAVFVFLNILGAGCLVTAILLGDSLTQMTFAGLLGGACVASLGIASLLGFLEIQSRHREKQLYARPLEPQADDYFRRPQRPR